MRSSCSTLLLSCIALAPPALAADAVTLSRGVPADVGLSDDVLRAGVALYEEAVERDDLKGAVLLVARRGKVVLHEAVGLRNDETGAPMERDTLFRMASNTKPVVATAVLMLQEEEKLDLEDLVRAHFPSWNNYRSGRIRIRHLLAHTSGLRIPTLFITPYDESSERCPGEPCLLAEVDRFGEVGAEAEPGTSYSYSNPGFNTLGGLIELVSGRPLEAFLRERIYEPLGMRDSYNHESKAPAARMARVTRRSEEGAWSTEWTPGDGPNVPFVRASGGMISTAWDYATFLQMILNGGTYGGQTFLSPESIALATRNHAISDATGAPLEEAYGFGWALYGDGVFGHTGSDGTAAWVDPERELVVLVFTQSPGGRLMRERFQKLVETAVD